MGERLSDDGIPGRRHAQPGGAASGPWEAHGAATLETVLAAALCRGDLDPQAERQAVAAFRDARATGAHQARTRRRDDWRPAAQRRVRLPVKTTLGVVFASLTLGGVAVAAIGSAGSSTDGAGAERGTTRPSAATPHRPDGTASSASSAGPRPTDRPARAQDTEAHCRAYERVHDRGQALDSRVWQQLVAAAGGKAKVAAYCSEQLTRPSAVPSRPVGRDTSGEGAAGADTGAAGRAGASGNSASVDDSGDTGKADGKGNSSGEGGGQHK